MKILTKPFITFWPIKRNMEVTQREAKGIIEEIVKTIHDHDFKDYPPIWGMCPDVNFWLDLAKKIDALYSKQ